MKIKISTASPDALSRETLILGFFADERPPKGYCGLVDWRLNGMISAEIAGGRISGYFLEKLACAFPRRIRVSRLLLLGMGALTELTCEKLYNAGFEIARTVNGMGATDLALPVPAAGRGPLPLAGMTEALITGMYDGCADERQRLSALDLEIPARDDHAYAIHRGLMQFRRNTGADIEIPGSEDGMADGTDARRNGESIGKSMVLAK